MVEERVRRDPLSARARTGNPWQTDGTFGHGWSQDVHPGFCTKTDGCRPWHDRQSSGTDISDQKRAPSRMRTKIGRRSMLTDRRPM